jgi:long-subunit acyl-CoA synthetase (AMP-forming)
MSKAVTMPAVPARDDITPDHLCTIIYTSGTTGKPKGVELSHRNIIQDLRGANELYWKYDDMQILGPQVSLAFLPWAHVFGMTCELHQLSATGDNEFAMLAKLCAELVRL